MNFNAKSLIFQYKTETEIGTLANSLFMVSKITPTQKSINCITEEQKISYHKQQIESVCGIANAMAFKHVKDVKVPLKLLRICRKYVNDVPRFGCTKNSFFFP